MRFCRRKTFRWNFFQGNDFQTSLGFFAGAISSDLRQYLYHPIYRIHVSLSQLLGWAFASWVILHPLWYLAGSLLGLCRELQRGECPFSVTLGRYFTPGFFRVDTTFRLTTWPETLPFWVVPANQRWHVVLDDASSIPLLIANHSHLLNEVTTVGSQLIAFLPRF